MAYTTQIANITLLGAVEDHEITPPISTIFFISSDISINGHISVVVAPNELVFSSDKVTISGHKTIVTNIPKQISFNAPESFVACYSGIIDNVVTAVSFSSSNIVPYVIENMAETVSGEINFSSNISISGHKTIVEITPPKFSFNDTATTVIVASFTVSFGYSIFNNPGLIYFSHPSISISGHKTIITPEPKNISFSSDAISILQLNAMVTVIPKQISFNAPECYPDVIYNVVFAVSGKIQYFVPEIILVGDIHVYPFMDLELPSFESILSAGVHLTESFPELDFAGNLFSGASIALNSKLPKLNLIIQTGGNITSELVLFESVITAKTNNIVGISCQFPVFILNSYLINNSLNSINLTIPKFSYSGNMTTGEIINFIGQLPKITFSSNSLAGSIMNFIGQLPKLKTSLSGSSQDDAYIEAVISSFLLEIQSGELASEVIRYLYRRIR